jgi:hypothetical protein
MIMGFIASSIDWIHTLSKDPYSRECTMIVVYITDARDEYARTIFDKVGLPPGCTVKLRYAEKWIQPALRESLASNSFTGRDVLVCYLNGNKGDLSAARAVACRYGQIFKSECIADFASIECKLLGFPSSPDLPDLFASADARGVLSPGPGSGFFLASADAPGEESLMDASPSRWGKVVSKLADCSFFRSASFLYCEGLTNSHGQKLSCEAGSFRIRANSIIRARIHTSAVSNESRLHHYEIRADDRAIEILDTNNISLAYGNEFFDVPIIVLPTDRSHPTIVRIEVGAGEQGASLAIPFNIQHRKIAIAAQRSAIAVSGAAAATAGVLPATVPLWGKVVLLAAGSIGLGLSARSPSS